MNRPYTLLSCAISLDGYLNDGTGERLVLSNDADLDRVDAERADCDAILVGAETVRQDNPSLTVRDRRRVEQRLARGLTATPTKVTLTQRGGLEPRSPFFTIGESQKLVYCTTEQAADLRTRLQAAATVVDAGRRITAREISLDLFARGVRRLMIEGGARVNTQFLSADLVDELQLAVAPFLVGNAQARRFVDAAEFPWDRRRRATLAEIREVGDMALLRYAFSARFQTADGMQQGTS